MPWLSVSKGRFLHYHRNYTGWIHIVSYLSSIISSMLWQEFSTWGRVDPTSTVNLSPSPSSSKTRYMTEIEIMRTLNVLYLCSGRSSSVKVSRSTDPFSFFLRFVGGLILRKGKKTRDWDRDRGVYPITQLHSPKQCLKSVGRWKGIKPLWVSTTEFVTFSGVSYVDFHEVWSTL